MPIRKRWYLPLCLPFYLFFLAFFYYTYVPLVKGYQLILIPLLISLVLIAAIKIKIGFLFFLFLLPLGGNLPYYFGLYENIPQAPVGLILFLFLFLGYLLHSITFYRSINLEKERSPQPKVKHPLQPFLGIFIALSLISGLITYLRYGNFFPFLNDSQPELIVNSLGVRAGGARMSALFSSLNIASGPILSLLLFPYLIRPNFRHLALKTIFFSFFLSLLFASLQFAFFPNFGHLPSWQRIGQFHSTYKDPNSFAFYLSAFLPLGFLLLLKIFLFDNSKKINLKNFVLCAALFLAVFHLAISGVRSAFLGSLLTAAAIIFFYSTQPKLASPRKKRLWLIFAVLAIFFFLIPIIFQSSLHHRLHVNLKDLMRANLDSLFSGKLTLWLIAAKIFTDFPLSGVGAGAYIIELRNYALSMGRSLGAVDSAENIFLQILSELGFIGFCIMAFMVGKIIFLMKKHLLPLKEIQNNYLRWGLAFSLMACLINFIFHSYIGGFDAAYLFWFLLTCLLAEFNFPDQSRADEAEVLEKENKKSLIKEIFSPILRSKRRTKLTFLACFLIVIIFGAANLVTSWKYLSIPRRTEKFGWDQDYGFYNWEKDNRGLDFRWAKKEAGLRLKILGPKIGLLVHASHPDIEKNPVVLNIFLADKWFKKQRLLFSIKLKDRSWHRLEIPIEQVLNNSRPSSFLPLTKDSQKETIKKKAKKDINSIINLRIEASRHWLPGQTLKIPDPRKIAFALGPIFFVYPSSFPEENLRILKSLSADQWTGDQGAILSSSGQAKLSFRIDEERCRLRLKIKGDKAFDLGPLIKIYLDHILIGQTLLEAEDWTFLYLPILLEAGEHIITVEFLNDFYVPSLNQDRNLHLGDVEIFKIVSLF